MTLVGAAPLAQTGVGEDLLLEVARGVALVAIAGALGAVTGFLYRWYARERGPDGLPMLVGLSGVALYLNTAGALGEVVGGRQDLLALDAAIFNVVIFVLAGLAAAAGGRLGDRAAAGLFAVSDGRSVGSEVTRFVETVGRVTAVELPAEIEDVEGYDPVEGETKEKLAGQVLLFPRRLTVEELRSQFVERLRTDYGVGHVDVDFDDEGTVAYLAVGARAAGIGPTLPPGSAAVAVRADPPNGAGPGDAVQVWTTDVADGESPPRRVTTGELRATADDVATLVVDETDAPELDVETRYRLVTLPVEPRPEREFAAQLRAAEETMSAVTVEAGSALADRTVGDVDVAVAALRTEGGELEAIPSRKRALSAGDTLYGIGRPARLRELETAASAGSAVTNADD